MLFAMAYCKLAHTQKNITQKWFSCQQCNLLVVKPPLVMITFFIFWKCNSSNLSLSWMFATVMYTGSCSGIFLWSVLTFSSHGALVLCDASFSYMLLQYCSVSGSAFCSHVIPLTLKVPFGWSSGEHIYSSDFCFFIETFQQVSWAVRWCLAFCG